MAILFISVVISLIESTRASSSVRLIRVSPAPRASGRTESKVISALIVPILLERPSSWSTTFIALSSIESSAYLNKITGVVGNALEYPALSSAICLNSSM